MGQKGFAPRDLEAAGAALHRRDSLVHMQRAGSSASLGSGGGRRRGAAHLTRLGLGSARQLVGTRWRMLALLVAGLMLHAMFSGGSRLGGGLSSGVAVAHLRTSEGEGAGGRSRSLVEQLPAPGSLGTLAAAAADLVAPLQQGPGGDAGGDQPDGQPEKEIPQEWLEGGTMDAGWPKPYRTKKRQVPPNSIYQWKCTPDAANFSLNAATSTPLLESAEWRQQHGDRVSIFKWCRAGLPEEVPQLQPVLKLESRKARPPRGLTVVTQLSLERFQMLDNQCSVWPYQISAVLYIPLLKGRIFSAEEPLWNKQSLDVGIAESIRFFQKMEASNTSCILDLEVVVEERCERYAAMLYPTNALRNRALVNVKTEAMLLVDVDFAVSLSLADIVRDEKRYGRLMTMLHSRNAVVLPAFETQDDGEAGRQVALQAVREGKPFVVNKFQWNVVFGFHVPQYPQGHQPTDYWRWIKAQAAYPVQYSIGYEPYIMLHRDYVPFYDERFRGYYWNKVQHLMHISLQHGFNFVVHPTAFVVHVPHKKPSTKWLTRKMGQKEKNHQLFDNALFHMRSMDFVPVTSFPELCTPQAAPVLANEAEIRRVAAQRLAQAEAEHQALVAANPALKAAEQAEAAAKRAAEAAAAAQWRAEKQQEGAQPAGAQPAAADDLGGGAPRQQEELQPQPEAKPEQQQEQQQQPQPQQQEQQPQQQQASPAEAAARQGQEQQQEVEEQIEEAEFEEEQEEEEEEEADGSTEEEQQQPQPSGDGGALDAGEEAEEEPQERQPSGAAAAKEGLEQAEPQPVAAQRRMLRR